MRHIKKGKQLMAMALSILLAISSLPAAAFAEEQPAQLSRICEHHQSHTADCGYADSQSCKHAHSEDCYTDELICGYKAGGSGADAESPLASDGEPETAAADSGTDHTHAQECYKQDCPHERGEHNDACGYAVARPCGYTCELCSEPVSEPVSEPASEPVSEPVSEPASESGSEPVSEPASESGSEPVSESVSESVSEEETKPESEKEQSVCTLTDDCTLTEGHEGECVTEQPEADELPVKTITDWTFIGDDFLNDGELPMPGVSMAQQADFDKVVSMLPTGISAEIEEAAETVPVDIVGWSCPEYSQDTLHNWPVTGTFTFLAALEEGYSCNPMPAVIVRLGGGTLYNSDYAFDSEDGVLSVFTNAGTKAWQNDVNIGKNEYERANAIKVVNFAGDNITAIEPRAFQSCINLYSADLPATVKTIGEAAFESCSNLIMTSLPANLETIGDGAFHGCTKFSATLPTPSKLTAIGKNAFNGCTGITSVTFPAGLGTIETSTFSGCTNLENVILPNDLRSIGISAFYDCRKLSVVQFPAGITSIGRSAFTNCTSLQSINLPASLEIIDDRAFMDCSGLKSISFPPRLRVIGNAAFYRCGNLTSLTFPASLEHILAQAFQVCSNVDTLIFQGNTPPTIGEQAFSETANTGIIYSPSESAAYTSHWMTVIGLSNWSLNAAFTPVLEVPFNSDTGGGTSMDNAMKTAVENAVAGKDKAKIITIKLTGTAASVTGYNWKYLRDLFLDNSGWDWLTTLDLTGMSSLTKVEYPETAVSAIPRLQHLSLPENLEEIGRSAFHNFTGLTNITFPSTLKTIGMLAFSNCTGLTDLSFPRGLQSIGTAAFTSCKNLNSLTFLGNAPSAEQAFPGNGGGTLYCPVSGTGYTGEWLNSAGLSGWTLTTQADLISQTIEKSTYSTATPIIGGTIRSTDGTYTANDGGVAGTHLYQWKRADNDDRTGNVTVLSSARDYTPTGADFGKYIWLETTPVGSNSLDGIPVKADVLRVGIRLTVQILGGGGGTDITVDGNTVSGSAYIYGPAKVSFTKTVASNPVLWAASSNEGTFSSPTSATTRYTPAESPTAGTIVLTADLTGRHSTAQGAFTVTGDSQYYTFNDPELIIKSGATLTIQNIYPETSTLHRIRVESGAKNVNLTLAGVNIDLSGTNDPNICAFDMSGAEVNLTLTEGCENILKSGSDRAGLEVPIWAVLTIQGPGKLTASGTNGAGIGGPNNNNSCDSGYITIKDSAKVTAISIIGAGIGGATHGHCQNITIQENAQVIASSESGAAIGGGRGSFAGRYDSDGVITITDNARVTATSDSGAGIGGGHTGTGGDIMIKGSAKVTATSNFGAGIGAGHGYGAKSITINENAQVTAVSSSGAGIGSAARIGSSPLHGGTINISGSGVKVTATGNFDIGSHDLGRGCVLNVTENATLEMTKTGTNSQNIHFENCIIIDRGKRTEYNSEGRPIASPSLSLAVSPAGSQIHPGEVTLTATLSGASPGIAGKEIQFTGSGNHSATTNDSGIAICTITNLSPGTYSFGASFEGDIDNKPTKAAQINNYTISFGTQTELTLNGLGSSYTYGDKPFELSVSGGSGEGKVSYASSDTSVAGVTGNRVTLLKAGTFTITAAKEGDSNYHGKTVTSGIVTVNPATPDVSLTATGGADINDPILLTATVPAKGTGITPIGTVTFKEGSTDLGTVSLNGSGKAEYTISSPAVGNHTYTVTYTGQSDYYNGNSATCTVGVGLADQTGFTVSDPGTKTYGDSDFSLTAAGGQSSGGVSFSVPDSNGVLNVTADGKANIIGAGKVTLTARKEGDSTYNQVSATREITVAARDISNVTVSVTGDRIHTGSRLQPVFEVKDGNIAITAGDYTNSYGANVNAGTDTGSITLSGQRNYSGTKTVIFEIEKRPLTNAAVTLAAGSYSHTGREIRPDVTSVVVDGITVPAENFDIEYANNIAVGTAIVTVTAKADGNFSGMATATFEITKSISSSDNDKHEENSSDNGRHEESSSGTSALPEQKDSFTVAGNQIVQTVSRSDMQRITDTGRSLTVQSDTVEMTFDQTALRTILTTVPAAASDIILIASPADFSAFSEAAAIIGSRPVYNFSIGYKDDNGNLSTVKANFPKDSISIALNYTPAKGEVPGNLFMVYVDASGAVTWINKSSYTAGNMIALADISQSSMYGIAYREAIPEFDDIINHWAKEDIEFVAARGLLSGVEEKLFSPDSAITRGMLVAALGRLAGVNPDIYQNQSFTDTHADAYYAPYAEWAVQMNIVSSMDGRLFSPDTPVTREQLAVIITNYAVQMGFSLPAPLAAFTFSDDSKISAWAAKEVAAMQQAGIIAGKDGNRFDPQENATRAEVSAALRRFIEAVIDSATVQGWTKNDSGHLRYYRDGKVLTGWQTIGNLRYFFNADGNMYEGWKQDPDTNKWYYWTNAGAATGWQKIGGKWYYFDENGIMAVNATIDGYNIGPDGTGKEN